MFFYDFLEKSSCFGKIKIFRKLWDFSKNNNKIKINNIIDIKIKRTSLLRKYEKLIIFKNKYYKINNLKRKRQLLLALLVGR